MIMLGKEYVQAVQCARTPISPYLLLQSLVYGMPHVVQQRLSAAVTETRPPTLVWEEGIPFQGASHSLFVLSSAMVTWDKWSWVQCHSSRSQGLHPCILRDIFVRLILRTDGQDWKGFHHQPHSIPSTRYPLRCGGRCNTTLLQKVSPMSSYHFLARRE